MPSEFISTPSRKFTLGNFNSEEFEDLINPKYTEKCAKCGKLYRSVNSEMVWAKRYPQYKNYCRECYIEEINKNPSEEQINEWADECVEITLNNPNWPMPYDMSYDIYLNKVKPLVEKKLKEIKNKEEKDAHQKRIDEAIELYKKANSTCDSNGESYDYHGYQTMNNIISINIIAELLKKIEMLENSLNSDHVFRC